MLRIGDLARRAGVTVRTLRHYDALGLPANGTADAWYLFDGDLARRGLESHGVNRQVFVDAPDGASEWVVKLQCPVRARGSACAT